MTEIGRIAQQVQEDLRDVCPMAQRETAMSDTVEHLRKKVRVGSMLSHYIRHAAAVLDYMLDHGIPIDDVVYHPAMDSLMILHSEYAALMYTDMTLPCVRVQMRLAALTSVDEWFAKKDSPTLRYQCVSEGICEQLCRDIREYLANKTRADIVRCLANDEAEVGGSDDDR